MVPDILDHTPCCISLATPLLSARIRPFKFFNFLSTHLDFLHIVANVWDNSENQVSSLISLTFKQKNIKKELKTLHKDNYSDIQKRVTEAKRIFISAQEAALLQPNRITFQLERDSPDKLNMLRVVEESYFLQKSRNNWYKTGDKNTSYFQKVAQSRNAYNSIHSLIGLDGSVVITPEVVGTLVVNHFWSILGPPIMPRDQTALPLISSIVMTICPPEAAALMSSSPSVENITKSCLN